MGVIGYWLNCSKRLVPAVRAVALFVASLLALGGLGGHASVDADQGTPLLPASGFYGKCQYWGPFRVEDKHDLKKRVSTKVKTLNLGSSTGLPNEYDLTAYTELESLGIQHLDGLPASELITLPKDCRLRELIVPWLAYSKPEDLDLFASLPTLTNMVVGSVNLERAATMGETLVRFKALKHLCLCDDHEYEARSVDYFTKQTVLFQALAEMTHLERVEIDIKPLSARSLTVFFERVKPLAFRCAHITDEQLRCIAPLLPDLRELDLSDSLVTDQGLACLQEFKNLERLNLARCPNVGDDSWPCLARCAKLRWLNLAHRGPDSTSYYSLAAARYQLPGRNMKKGYPVRFMVPFRRDCPFWGELRGLDLSGNAIVSDDDLAAVVECCPKLEELNISGCPEVTDQSLKHLSKLAGLRSLVMREVLFFGCDESPRDLEQKLSSRKPVVSSNGLRQLAQCKSLKDLQLACVTGDGSSPTDLSFVAELSLESFTLCRGRVHSLKPLLECKSVCLEGCDFTDLVVEEVDFEKCQWQSVTTGVPGSPFVKYLAQMKNLEHLYWNRITPELDILDVLATSPSLKTVRLGTNDEGVKKRLSMMLSGRIVWELWMTLD